MGKKNGSQKELTGVGTWTQFLEENYEVGKTFLSDKESFLK